MASKALLRCVSGEYVACLRCDFLAACALPRRAWRQVTSLRALSGKQGAATRSGDGGWSAWLPSRLTVSRLGGAHDSLSLAETRLDSAHCKPDWKPALGRLLGGRQVCAAFGLYSAPGLVSDSAWTMTAGPYSTRQAHG